MFAVVGVQKGGLYSVVDTRDGVIEEYTAEQLFYIADTVKILGLDKKSGSIRCLSNVDILKVFEAQNKLSGDNSFEFYDLDELETRFWFIKTPSKSVSNLVIPYGVGTIEPRTFKPWKRQKQYTLDTVILPSTVIWVKRETFTSVPVKRVIFRDGLLPLDGRGCMISEDAFRDSSITSFEAPSMLESLGRSAFAGCADLSYVSFVKTSIPFEGYRDGSLYGVKKVYFPASLFEDANGNFKYSFSRSVLVGHLNRIFGISGYFEDFYDLGAAIKKTSKGYLLEISKEV